MLYLSQLFHHKLNLFKNGRIDIQYLRQTIKYKIANFDCKLTKNESQKRNWMENNVFSSQINLRQDRPQKIVVQIGIIHLNLQQLEKWKMEENILCYQEVAEQKLCLLTYAIQQILLEQKIAKNDMQTQDTLMGTHKQVISPSFCSPTVFPGNHHHNSHQNLSYLQFVLIKIISPYIKFIRKKIISKINICDSQANLEGQEIWKVINFYRSFITFTNSFPYCLRYFKEQLIYPILMIVELLDHEIKQTYWQVERYFRQRSEIFPTNNMVKDIEGQLVKKYNLTQINGILDELFVIRDGFILLYHNKHISDMLKLKGIASPNFQMLTCQKIEFIRFLLSTQSQKNKLKIGFKSHKMLPKKQKSDLNKLKSMKDVEFQRYL